MDNPVSLDLPVAASMLVPHRPPLLLVDRLLEITEESGVVEAKMTGTSLLADESGRVDPLAAVELMAQACAAVKGYRDRQKGLLTPGKGFLVGVRKFRVAGTLSVGDLLKITVRTVAGIAGFSVTDAEVTRSGSTIASATLKLWVPTEEGERG